jgi:hypothetical protein
MKKLIALAMMTAAFACGSDSGVSGSKLLKDLTVAEIKSECLDTAADFPERTVTCGNGSTVTLGNKEADCNDTTNPFTTACTATVADLRACFDAQKAQTDAQLCMTHHA